MANTLRLVAASGGSIDLHNVPLDDRVTLELLSSGNFAGIPYLENPWVGGLLRPFRDISFADLVILCGLLPPLSRASGLIEEYLGDVPPPSLHPALDPVLSESRGLILFREQVVEIIERTIRARTAEAETLSRALSAGDPAELSTLQPGFLARAMMNGFDARDASGVWLKLVAAAPVSVLKAHAVSLALMTYRTAYLKARFPVEFMDSFMRSEEINREKQEMALREWRSTHLRLVPPKFKNT
jgi:DNA polymerase-3 subunit alpha